ncbi:MAG: SOS response-associated peptidase [Clostridiales bacterium]|nr:SOS response-associated peptidase [Clostridiales bacterium]
MSMQRDGNKCLHTVGESDIIQQETAVASKALKRGRLWGKTGKILKGAVDMCGRYYIAQEDNDEEIARIIAELNKDTPQAAEIHLGEIFPSQVAPVIVNTPSGWAVKPMKWGFPRNGGGGLVINSRSEKADVTPMFSKAVRERRCLVPMSGFYEWRRTATGAKTKEKFAFTLAEKGPMFLAGVYGLFGGGYEAGGYDGFAILTQAADEQMLPFHHRMPVILSTRQARHGWLFAPPQVNYGDLRSLFRTPGLLVKEAGTNAAAL